MERIVCLLIGYAFGLFQTSYIIGKINGIDIREKGSGNAGTTNTLRVLGKKAGLIVMLTDICKTALAVLVVWIIYHNTHAEEMLLLKLYTGLGAVLGHNFPFYMHFKGGKGIAAMGGMILTFDWPFIPFGLLLFFGTVAITHYVSFASLLLSAGFYVMLLVMGIFKIGRFAMIPGPILTEMYVVAFVIVAMAFIRHSENIKKLLRGEERKTYINKKNDPR